ncbi:hypothetical protein PAMP_024556 [Pampus punctatissimus]
MAALLRAIVASCADPARRSRKTDRLISSASGPSGTGSSDECARSAWTALAQRISNFPHILVGCATLSRCSFSFSAAAAAATRRPFALLLPTTLPPPVGNKAPSVSPVAQLDTAVEPSCRAPGQDRALWPGQGLLLPLLIRHADQWMWAVSATGLPPESAGVGCAAFTLRVHLFT